LRTADDFRLAGAGSQAPIGPRRSASSKVDYFPKQATHREYGPKWLPAVPEEKPSTASDLEPDQLTPVAERMEHAAAAIAFSANTVSPKSADCAFALSAWIDGVAVPPGAVSADPRGWVGTFCGRSVNSPGCWDVNCNGTIVSSSSVQVDEEHMPRLGSQAHQPLPPTAPSARASPPDPVPHLDSDRPVAPTGLVAQALREDVPSVLVDGDERVLVAAVRARELLEVNVKGAGLGARLTSA
jgi:hypothetical protein